MPETLADINTGDDAALGDIINGYLNKREKQKD